jgi:glucose-6-phosphate 1-dehydrogenase
VEKTAAQHQTGGNAVFYLAVAPRLFGTIIEQLGASAFRGKKPAASAASS